MQNKKTALELEERWWHDATTAEQWKEVYHQALNTYLENTGSAPEDVQANVMLCKTLIPIIGQEVKDWHNFPLRLFLVGNYKAHAALRDNVKNRLDHLIRENLRIKQEEEIIARSQELMRQQPKQEQIEDQSQDSKLPCRRGRPPTYQMETRRSTGNLKSPAGSQPPERTFKHSKKEQVQKTIVPAEAEDLEINQVLRPIDIARHNVILKKRELKAALKAYHAEKAKDPAYTTPQGSDAEESK